MNRLYKNKDWLYQKYWKESLSIPKIAKLCGVAYNTMCYWLEKFNIKRRIAGEAMRGENNPNWGGGKPKDSNGYILVSQHDHPYADCRGYVREHRFILEKKLGRCLEYDEVSHHANGIKDGNRPENLRLMDKNHHIRYHRQIYWRNKRNDL